MNLAGAASRPEMGLLARQRRRQKMTQRVTQVV